MEALVACVDARSPALAGDVCQLLSVVCWYQGGAGGADGDGGAGGAGGAGPQPRQLQQQQQQQQEQEQEQGQRAQQRRRQQQAQRLDAAAAASGGTASRPPPPPPPPTPWTGQQRTGQQRVAVAFARSRDGSELRREAVPYQALAEVACAAPLWGQRLSALTLVPPRETTRAHAQTHVVIIDYRADYRALVDYCTHSQTDCPPACPPSFPGQLPCEPCGRAGGAVRAAERVRARGRGVARETVRLAVGGSPFIARWHLVSVRDSPLHCTLTRNNVVSA